MAQHDDDTSGIGENSTHLTIVDGTGLAAIATHDIDTLIVKGHAFQSCDIILSEMAHDAVSSRYRHRQAPSVGLEAIVHHSVHR